MTIRLGYAPLLVLAVMVAGCGGARGIEFDHVSRRNPGFHLCLWHSYDSLAIERLSYSVRDIQSDVPSSPTVKSLAFGLMKGGTYFAWEIDGVPSNAKRVSGTVEMEFDARGTDLFGWRGPELSRAVRVSFDLRRTSKGWWEQGDESKIEPLSGR